MGTNDGFAIVSGAIGLITGMLRDTQMSGGAGVPFLIELPLTIICDLVRRSLADIDREVKHAGKLAFGWATPEREASSDCVGPAVRRSRRNGLVISTDTAQVAADDGGCALAVVRSPQQVAGGQASEPARRPNTTPAARPEPPG